MFWKTQSPDLNPRETLWTWSSCIRPTDMFELRLITFVVIVSNFLYKNSFVYVQDMLQYWVEFILKSDKKLLELWKSFLILRTFIKVRTYCVSIHLTHMLWFNSIPNSKNLNSVFSLARFVCGLLQVIIEKLRDLQNVQTWWRCLYLNEDFNWCLLENVKYKRKWLKVLVRG